MNRKQPAFTGACLLPLGFALAQTSPTDPHCGQITVTPPVSQKVIAGSPNRFTGSVRVRSLFDAKSPAPSTGGEVTFQPGARSAWHTHPLGQVLIVTDGVGWVQQWGSPVQVMNKGDVVWIPPGVSIGTGRRRRQLSRTSRSGRTGQSGGEVDGEGHG
jgi:quercetin dioxygenase-like cupin family protein